MTGRRCLCGAPLLAASVAERRVVSGLPFTLECQGLKCERCNAVAVPLDELHRFELRVARELLLPERITRSDPEALSFVRHALGLTRSAFGARVGQSENDVVRWEVDGSMPERAVELTLLLVEAEIASLAAAGAGG